MSLERLAALYPAAGPRDVMQRLWDSAQSLLNGPVVVLIPGHVDGIADLFIRRRNETSSCIAATCCESTRQDVYP